MKVNVYCKECSDWYEEDKATFLETYGLFVSMLYISEDFEGRNNLVFQCPEGHEVVSLRGDSQ